MLQALLQTRHDSDHSLYAVPTLWGRSHFCRQGQVRVTLGTFDKKISNYNKHSWVVTKINTTYWYRHLASLWKEQNSLIDDITRDIAFWNKPKRRNVFRMRFVRVYFILYSLSYFKQYFYYLKSSGECTIASTIELRIMARSCSCIEKGMGSPGCVSWSAQLLEIIFFK